MGFLIGSIGISQRMGGCKLLSVMLTAGAAAAALTITPFGLSASSNSIIINAGTDATAQVQFGGILYDNGIVVTPDSNTLSYVVEYEAIE